MLATFQGKINCQQPTIRGRHLGGPTTRFEGPIQADGEPVARVRRAKKTFPDQTNLEMLDDLGWASQNCPKESCLTKHSFAASTNVGNPDNQAIPQTSPPTLWQPRWLTN